MGCHFHQAASMTAIKLLLFVSLSLQKISLAENISCLISGEADCVWHRSSGLVMPGATACLDAPLPNSRTEQWRRPAVVIATVYALFVTSQNDVTFTFANQRFGEICWHNRRIQWRRSSGRAGRPVKMLRTMETYNKTKSLPIMFVSVHQQCWPQK